MAQTEKIELTGDKYEYESEFRSDLDMHDRYITDWDAYEAMLISKTYDSVSKQTKNGITDGDAATMVIERAARVVGQLPDGVTEAAGKRDKGKAMLMDIIRQKYIYPNANAQRPLLDKLRLWEMYSGVYGAMPMFVDWDVRASGYIGPNTWLWSPRNFIPQQGRFTVDDMDYAHAISWMSHKEIEDLIENWDKDSGWNKENLETVLETAKQSSKDMDNHRTSYIERSRTTSEIKGRVEIVTRFEAGEDGKWITFTPRFGCLELRNVANPHKTAQIPFFVKPDIQLFDSYYGLSSMARAKPLQFAKDGLTNFYFQGIKMNIYPPTVVNSQGIVKHTVSNEPGSIWEEIIPNSARRLETSTAGLATYQAAMGQMAGALQNVFGTTTTQANADSAMSSQFGKTPEALKYQQGRESARDNQNRTTLQTCMEQVVDYMFELIVNIGTEDIKVDLFSEDIQSLVKAGYDDVLEMVIPNESMKAGRLIIDPKSLKGVSYRFNMKADSTMKMTKQEQKQNLLDFIGEIGKHQNELQEIQKSTGKTINWEQIFSSYAEVADLPGLDDVFIQGEKPEEEKANPILELIKVMNVQYAELPEDAKNAILTALGVQNNDLSPRQQEIDIKRMQASSSVLTAHAQQEETPTAVNGMLFKDKATGAAAESLAGLMKGPSSAR